MSAKRSADALGSPVGKRRLKQTRLSFFARAPKHHQESIATSPQENEESSVDIQDKCGNGPGILNSASATPDAASDTTDETDAFPSLQQQQRSFAPSPPSLTTRVSTLNTANTPTTVTTPAITPTTPRTTARIRITDRTGDLFAAPRNTLLVHACNAKGSWGGGIALAFKKRYPDAYLTYRADCHTSTPDQLLGTALLIPPHRPSPYSRGPWGHYIGCLFTSRGYGPRRDPPEIILKATAQAMSDLMRLVVEEEESEKGRIAEMRMCRINSGLFAVPWEETKAVIEGMELGDGEVPGCVEGGVVEVVAWEKE